MANLMRRPRSPFWYVQYRDPKTGGWRRKATKYRAGIGSDTRKARELAAEYSLRESQDVPATNKEHWKEWAGPWLASLKLSPKSITRYQSSWENLMVFFRAREISAPRYVTYAVCMDYMEWRKKTKLGHKKMPACHNTARLELQVLGFVMGEAVRRGFTAANPCRELHIGRDKPREKPELSDRQITKIRKALESEAEWMRDAFELAIHHGCRLSECRVPMTNVDFKRGVITFGKTKGDKPFSVPIHPGILPLLKRKAESKAKFVSDVPGNDSKPFTLLFKKLGLEGVSFHSTRVSVVSRLARCPEIKQEVAMRYVNHSSELVHRIYQRLGVDDVRGVSGALHIPKSESRGDPPATPEHEEG